MNYLLTWYQGNHQGLNYKHNTKLGENVMCFTPDMFVPTENLLDPEEGIKRKARWDDSLKKLPKNWLLASPVCTISIELQEAENVF